MWFFVVLLQFNVNKKIHIPQYKIYLLRIQIYAQKKDKENEFKTLILSTTLSRPKVAVMF